MLQSIKTSWLNARKNHDTQCAVLLTTVIGETEMLAKNDKNRAATNEDALKTLRKFEKNLVETISVLEKTDRVEQLKFVREELVIIREFLPAKLTDLQVQKDIGTAMQKLGIVKAVQKDQGAIVKELREKYGDQFDGAQVSAQFKAMLA